MMSKMFCALLLAAAGSACARNAHDLPQPAQVLPVVNATVSTVLADGELEVTVIGELKNTTAEKVDNLVMEARLTDANGKVIDVLNEKVYGLVAPAGDQVAFRLNGPATAEKAQYVGAQVRVISADVREAVDSQKGEQSKSVFVDFAVAWGPMLLLISVWILMYRKYSGKGSTANQMLHAIKEQNELLARQSAAIESIAAVLKAPKQ